MSQGQNVSPLPLRECVICDATIWQPTEGYLCLVHWGTHQKLRRSPNAIAVRIGVDSGKRSDFYGRNHRLELFVPSRAPRHWTVELGDLLRALGVRYDDAGEGSSAA